MRKNSIRFNERKKQLQLEVEQEKERLRQARKSCPHNTQQPTTSVVIPRSKSPPIPALKNKLLPYSTNVDSDSIFAKSHNKNTDTLAEQIRKLNAEPKTNNFAYKNFESNSAISDDFATKVASWDISNGYKEDRKENLRRSVSQESASDSHSGSDFTENNKQHSSSEVNEHIIFFISKYSSKLIPLKFLQLYFKTKVICYIICSYIIQNQINIFIIHFNMFGVGCRSFLIVL